MYGIGACKITEDSNLQLRDTAPTLLLNNSVGDNSATSGSVRP